MCFSVEADVVAGAALLPVAALSLSQVRHRREVPFAALPLVFSLHQLTEAFVWHDTSTSWAVLAYVIVALPLLPALVPLAILLLEPPARRGRVAPFAALGLAVSGVLLHGVLAHPITVVVHPHALEYDVGLWRGDLMTVLYVVAVIGPAVVSGYRSIVLFGWLNLIGLSLAAYLYVEAFASIWCVYAAMLSVLVLRHMVKRRQLLDPYPAVASVAVPVRR